LKSLKRFKTDDREQVRCSGIKLTTAYLEKFNDQVVVKLLDDESKFKVLSMTSFIADYCTNDLLKHMLDYYEDIKMAACDCANLVIEKFLPIEPQFASEQMELLQQLRSSISLGWSQ